MTTSQQDQNPVRKNGFQQPWSSPQLSTWMALPVLVIEYLIVVTPILPWQASIPCTLVFSITAVLAAYYACRATMTDAVDEHLKKYMQQKEEASKKGEQVSNGNSFGGCLGGINDSGVEPLKHCWICETQVAEHAMHCKFCNKCIGQFDHHCMWLNTCVGKANYPFFWMTMVWITVMLVVHMLVQAVLVVDYFAQLGGTRQRANDWFNAGAANVLAGFLIGFVIFDFVALTLIIQLLAFHMKLQKEGLTTYKFIVRESQRKREEKKKQADRQTKRMVAMGKANDEGKTLLALRLRYGEYVACCDPFPLDVDAPENDQNQNRQQTSAEATLPEPTTSNGSARRGGNALSVALSSFSESAPFTRVLPDDVPYPPIVEESVEEGIMNAGSMTHEPKEADGVTFLPVGE